MKFSKFNQVLITLFQNSKIKIPNMNQINQTRQKQIFPIEILGAIICANSIFTLLTFVVSVLSLSNISKVLTGTKLTDSELWFNSLSTGMSQVSGWTALLGGILWLVWFWQV